MAASKKVSTEKMLSLAEMQGLMNDLYSETPEAGELLKVGRSSKLSVSSDVLVDVPLFSVLPREKRLSFEAVVDLYVAILGRQPPDEELLEVEMEFDATDE